jgi:type IV pilus assembly protein PilY1
MKNNKRTAMPLLANALASAVLLCMCWLFPTAGSGQVCGKGVGVPPFLSSGSSANLMMVLDNSGSMLDLAYVNAATQCFDETYTSAKPYAGYFEENAWYTWESDGEKWNSTATGSDSWVAHWKQAKTYAAGDIVYANGGLYKATRNGSSDDTKPNDGLNISDDTGPGSPGWIPISQATTVTSLAATCTDDDLVAYNNSVYICKTNKWTRLEGGQFVKIDPDTYPDPVTDYCDTIASGTKYQLSGELCTRVLEVDVNGQTVQQQMYLFVARGNLLNWAMTSKFDIQKKILSGGKYVDEKILSGNQYIDENQGNGQLVGESRGCSGYGFVKQVPVTKKSDGSASKLVMRVRGAKHDDRVGDLPEKENSDDTTRLEIIGLTATGFNQGACQDAIDTLTSGTGLGTLKQEIDACMTGGNDVGDAHGAYVHSINICSGIWRKDVARPIDLNGSGQIVNALTGNCENLYAAGYSPRSMSPEDGGYVCYGIYDNTRDHRDRVGYVGRCWDTVGTSTGGTAVVCDYKGEVIDADGGCDRGSNTLCTYCVAGPDDGYCTTGDIYKNEGGYNYKCKNASVTYKNNQGYFCKKDTDPNDWDLLYADPTCVPSSGGGGTTTAGWVPTWSSNSKPGEDPDLDCISWALLDFCAQNKQAEVIDPSDSASVTNDFYNAPAILIDGGVLGQLGIAKPLIVFKGLIDYELPEEQKTDAATQPNGPRGVIYEFASDLRMGVMAFEDNGARTECDVISTKCVDTDANDLLDVCETAQGGDPAGTDCTFCLDRTNVVKYCPANNGDGAKVLQSIDFGMYNDGTQDVWDHYKDLVTSINGTRATAWTPLAEAMFTAVGYYTQNDKFCLEKDDQGECTSFNISEDDDPIQYWCQSNHVLIITEGASTADINDKVRDFTVNSDKSAYFTGYDAGTNSGSCNGISTGAGCVNSKGIDIVDDVTGDNVDPNLANGVDENYDGGVADNTCTDDGLDGSTYLDDITWWGRNVLPLYAHRKKKTADDIWEDKQNITTHIVTTGSLRDDGTATECNPKELMSRAAFNGGTDDYYLGENPQQLEASLRAVFNDILSRSSSGSAASVISNSRSGSGAVYQAVFWPNFEDANGHKVSWVGDVHALFMSPEGLMYEDTNQDAKLDTSPGADKRVILYYSDNVGRTRGCYQSLNALGVCPDDADYVEDKTCPAGGGLSGLGCVELLDVKYLWSADKQLRDMVGRAPRKIFTWNDADNDGIVDTDAQNKEWFELKTGSVSTGGVDWAALNATAASTAKTGATSPWPRGPVTRDFLSPEDWETFVADDGTKDDPAKELVADNDFPPDPLGLDALNSLIDWLHGNDHLNNGTISVDGRLDKILRSRTFSFPGTSGTVDAEWKLGDVIHSTPTVVNKPAEVYHYIYRDPTYKKFADRWADRRSVIYFGANDGMLHAVNGGFYQESTSQFCCSFKPAFDTATGLKNTDAGTCVEPAVVNGVAVCTDHQLGDELWVYIPYNLQPHLKCLADPSYRHKYYVDQKPRIFDVQIFTEESACSSNLGGTTGPGTLKYQQECVHAGGWGTILVGGMGFGGAPIQADSLNGMTADTREFSSSFFILDITNPEADPVLLGEMTRPTNQYVDLNYTTSTPAMVIMRSNEADTLSSSWYLVMGSGPSEEDGRNISEGKLAVFPLNRLTGEVAAASWTAGVPTAIIGNSKKSFRILDQKPGNTDDTNITTEAGVFRVPGAGPAYISDMISVDYDVELSSNDTFGSRYRSDAIYFGTTDGGEFAQYPEKYLEDYPDDYYYWKKGGRLFRLVTKVLNSDGKDVYSKPSEWAGQWTTPSTSDPSPVRMLVDAKMPIVAGPAIGFDGSSFWVYAGTGHFYDAKDKTDDGWCTETIDTNCKTGETNSKISFFGIREPVKDAQSNFTDWTTPPSNITCEDNVLTWSSISYDNAGTLTSWDINEQDNQDLVYNGKPGQRGLIQTDNILVQTGTGYLDCYDCKTGNNGMYTCSVQNETVCFPGSDDLTTAKEGPIYDDNEKQYTFSKLKNYIAGTGCDAAGNSTGIDGWYRDFSDPRERNLGTAALLGGLVTYTSYQPFSDKCKSEGQGFLYAVHFQTGTAWTESVFGTFDNDGTLHKDDSGTFVKDKMSTGQGMSTTPSMHVGAGSEGASAFVQTSTGEIVEIKQENLPLNNTKSGRINWNDRCSQ